MCTAAKKTPTKQKNQPIVMDWMCKKSEGNQAKTCVSDLPQAREKITD